MSFEGQTIFYSD
jgi:hypothetical protein